MSSAEPTLHFPALITSPSPLFRERNTFVSLILSLHSGIHDSAGALFDDYEIIAAVQKERLTRNKKAGGPPLETIPELLDIGGISMADVDTVVFSRGEFDISLYKPGMQRHFGDEGRNRKRKTRGVWYVMMRAKTFDPGDVLDLTKLRDFYGLGPDKQLFFANHHLTHALPALFFTDWDNALLYTADAVGDNVNYSHHVFKNGELRTLFGDDRWLLKPYRTDSLARGYANVTEALGFIPNRHEGKVTGLAAFGKPVLADAFKAHFFFDDDGLINSDFDSPQQMREYFMSLCEGHSREDASASIQTFVEDFAVESIRRLLAREDVANLGLAGGLFANVKINQRLAEECDVEEVFIVPPMGDEGLVIGGVHQYLLERDGLETWLKHRHRLDDVYWARDFGAATDQRILSYSPDIERLPGDPVTVAAELLAGDKVVAIFSKRMEFGPRALGARSILASPAERGINDALNKRLDRSEFMPFAPFVAEEDCREVFQVTDTNAYACRFMTITCAVKPEWAPRIPAVVHVDNTARPQVIRRSENALYYNVLKAFKERTGLPVLVNTSFNIHEQPIVNSPEEAAAALVENRVDYLMTESGVYGVRSR